MVEGQPPHAQQQQPRVVGSGGMATAAGPSQAAAGASIPLGLPGSVQGDPPPMMIAKTTLSPEQLPAFEASLKALFGKQSVCSMANIRQSLADPASSLVNTR